MIGYLLLDDNGRTGRMMAPARMVLVVFLLAVVLTAPSSAWAKKLKFNVDISSVPPRLELAVSFREPSGNKVLDAGEQGVLDVTVTNRGTGDAYGVVLRLDPGQGVVGIDMARAVKLGRIPAGTGVRKSIALVTNGKLAAGSLRLRVSASEAGGFDADPVTIAFETREFQPPRLVVADMAIDDQSGNRAVEPMENVEVTVRVQNIGRGDAHRVTADILLGENVFMGGARKTHFNLGLLNPGQYKDLSFIFYTNKRLAAGHRIPITVQLNEAREAFSASTPLALVMNARQKGAREIVVKGSAPVSASVGLSTGLSVDVDQHLPASSMSNRDAIAVVIGNRDYVNAKGVEYAVNDARAIRDYLVKVLGYRDGNIFFIENASKGDFQRFFGVKGDHKGKLFNAVKAGKSDVFVYYSGHGAPGLKDRKGYFVPVEADPQYLNLEGFPLDVFFENLSRLPARNLTIVLDACFSGASIFEKISPMVIEIDAPAMRLNGGVVISSSTGSQVSSWYDDKKHGMFTYFFLKAIHERNGDANGDGVLTFEELYSFIADKSEGVPYYSRRLHGVDQNPMIQGDYRGKAFVNY